MASLLTAQEIYNFTGQFQRHFDTFSAFNTIIVNKEPIQTIINTGQNFLHSYGFPSSEVNVEYTPVSESFNAIVKYPGQPDNLTMTDIKITLDDGEALIKVNEETKRYIENGKTENVELNGYKYNIISNVKIQNYLGLKFYYFKLGLIK